MKRGYIQSIKIEFKSLEDLFNLPCVLGLKKLSSAKGGIVVLLSPSLMADKMFTKAYKGQWLSENLDGKWHVTDSEQ